MRNGLRWKLCAVCGVTLFFATLVVTHGLKLGLDLRGGVHLLLRVDVDPTLDLSLREEAIDQTQRAIARRVDELGVMEPTIVRQGRGSDRLVIQLPGVTDIERAKQTLGATGALELRLVDAGPSPSREQLMANGALPANADIVPEARRASTASPDTTYYLLRRPAIVTGGDIRTARPGADEYGLPAVTFTLAEEAGRVFGEVTAANLGQRLAVVLDGQVQSVATIETRISTDGQIRGPFTAEDVADLAVVLRSGALPTTVTHLGQTMIGPSLGADSIRAGVAASVGGLILVATFMVAFYGWWGVNAVAAMFINLTILLGLMAYMEAFLTLPGIAGLILTIGMGVDSNVLIFERMKEELAAGQSSRGALRAAFSRVFVTLLDTHVAALIAAGCLFQFGTGSIRGFAVTLSLGLISNLFTSTFVSRTLFELGQRPPLRATAGASST
jgi:preprotein translocase subunit SecD